MKTIVIQLDAHDDLISVRDKMVWSKAQRILLVWPEEGHPGLRRKYDLVSLQRHAIELGAQLGLVTRDLEVNANARELGVAVFHSVKQAQRQRWQRTRVRRRFRRRAQNPERVNALKNSLGNTKPSLFQLGWSRLAIFTCGVLAVLVMGMFLLPGATVQIQPVQQEQSISMTLTADPNLTGPSLGGVVPAERVTTVVEVQGQIDASGKINVPDRKARGTITFTNLTNRSLILPAGSIVSTLPPEAIRFATTQEVILPAGAGTVAEVSALSLAGGAAGNVAAETVKVLEGAMGPGVLVTNLEPFSGGSDRVLPAVTQADYQKLRAQLIETLRENAQKDLALSLGSTKSLLASTLTLEPTLQESSLPEVGEPGDVLILNLRAEFSAMAVSGQDLARLATAALDANLAKGLRVVPSTLAIAPASRAEKLAGGRVEWTATATRRVAADLPRETLLKAVLGRRPPVAAGNLMKLMDLEIPPKITLNPSWWFWMPSLGFRIQFEVR